MKIRPKGSNQPFRPAHDEEDGRYAIKYQMKGAMTGQPMEFVQWYKPDELEMEQ